MLEQRLVAVLPKLFARRRDHHANARLDEICEFAPREGALEDRVFWFVRLVAWVRPRGTEDARTRVRFLRAHLESHPELRTRVAETLTALAKDADVDAFLTYGGIPRDFHLLGAIGEWLTARMLPSACRTNDVERILRLAFRDEDFGWLRASGLVPLFVDLLPAELLQTFADGARDAARDLVHQIVAQAHAPSLRALSAPRSPFRDLYEAVTGFLATPDDMSRYEALRGRLTQCRIARDALRAQLAERGADVQTTFLLMRIERQLLRVELLVLALHEGKTAAPRVAVSLAHRALTNARARHLLARSSELVVRNLVDTTADVGDHYLDERTSTFRAAFLAGAGGGLLMVIATMVKLGLGALHMSPLYEGLAFAINYASAFCAAYLLHFTIATKLPAHTAAALARSVRGEMSRRDRVAACVDVLRALVRLQLAGLIGNLVVAGPLAFGIAYAVQKMTGHPFVSAEKAHHLLHSNSILGPSALYAALTGVFLWVSSLVGAAVDNWARVNRVDAALATAVPVMTTIGAPRAESAAQAVASRIGGLSGNAFLGFLLGAVPALFAVASLPVEIRHVTVSTGSVGVAMATGTAPPSAVALAIAGVLVIGLVNVAVSFALALWLALRASDDAGSGRVLLAVGLRRAIRS